MFQSLLGFKINWNRELDAPTDLFVKFQSLLGFKINWNNWCFRTFATKSGFNPY